MTEETPVTAPTIEEFMGAVEAYADARDLFTGRTGFSSLFIGHSDDPGAVRAKQERLIEEALDAKRAARQRLTEMYTRATHQGLRELRDALQKEVHMEKTLGYGIEGKEWRGGVNMAIRMINRTLKGNDV